MSGDSLFDKSEFLRSCDATPEETPGGGQARMQFPQRHQEAFHFGTVDDLLPEEHPARDIWAYTEKIDLSPLVAKIKAVEGNVGRPPVHPQILLAIWLYATVEGIGSARYLAKLCETHAAFLWICGGVSVNHHLLSDFRRNHEAFLDELLTYSVAVLMQQGVVDLNRVAQDGVRVRASAGKSSFHRQPTLEHSLQEAREQVERLKQEMQEEPQAGRTRSQAAQQRAARERVERLQAALGELEKIKAKKSAPKQPESRASSTDPEARVMKFSDGGFRPGFNVQFATDTKTQVVIGVDVINVGSDKGQLKPMHQQIEKRYGVTPEEYLADGDFMSSDDIDHLEAQGTKVYVPVKKPQNPDRPVDAPVDGDTQLVAGWRKRMTTDEAKTIYKDRASSIECVNAHARNRGLQQFRVRGIPKARSFALIHAIVQNIACTKRLLPNYFWN
jgi:transposase